VMDTAQPVINMLSYTLVADMCGIVVKQLK